MSETTPEVNVEVNDNRETTEAPDATSPVKGDGASEETSSDE